MKEIDEAKEYIHKALQDSYVSQNPNDLSDYLVALSGWRFRLGQILAERTLNYEIAYIEKKRAEDAVFIQFKGTGKTNEESRSLAQVSCVNEAGEAAKALHAQTEVKMLWEDIKVAIDSIKYKINSLLTEKGEI